MRGSLLQVIIGKADLSYMFATLYVLLLSSSGFFVALLATVISIALMHTFDSFLQLLSRTNRHQYSILGTNLPAR